MVCNVCGQSEATIHLTEILNNQMVEVHLCESCAEQKGTDFKVHFDFNKLLASLGDIGVELQPERLAKVSCKDCGMTYEEFGRTGRLGCVHCYQGYHGRVGLFEILPITAEFIEQITKGADLASLNQSAKQQGMMSLYESGLEKAALHLTTVEEVQRVCPF